MGEERPETTDRECMICHATVAAWPNAMCCHCGSHPWRKIVGPTTELPPFEDLPIHPRTYPDHIAAIRLAREAALNEAANIVGPVEGGEYSWLANRIRQRVAHLTAERILLQTKGDDRG